MEMPEQRAEVGYATRVGSDKGAGRGAICQNPVCQRPLSRTWDEAGRFCCQCGLDHDLFHRETRWQDAASDEPPMLGAGGKLPSKSAAVGARSAQLRIVRLGLKVLAAVAPAVAEERAAGWFFTPRRAPRRTPPQIAGMAAVSSHLTVGEQEIACWSWGRGPTVILVHGWEGYAAQLSHFVQPLISAGFRVVAFDMPAHGGSTGRQLSVFDMSRAIQAVAEIFSPIRGVIAHSLGGTATILGLSEGLEVERAVLLAPAAEPRHFARSLATLLGFSEARADGMLKRIEHRLGMRLEDASTLLVVPTMNVPLLVMHDPRDAEVPFEHGKRIAEAWPGARLELLNEMGHRRMLRDADVINAITAFIANQDE